MKKIIIIILYFTFTINASPLEIENDFRGKKLTLDEKVLYTAQSLYEPEKLPEKYKREKTFYPSGFLIVASIKEQLSNVGPKTRRLLEQMIDRPGGLPRKYQTPGGQFLVHYTVVGRDSVDISDSNDNDIPDLIETAGEILDSVYNAEVIEMGYRDPKRDDIDGSAIDIYFQALDNTYGITAWDESNSTSCTPYIQLQNDLSDSTKFTTPGLDGLRITIAHEFFHAIQVGYRWDYDYMFWYEMSSVWMEDQMYDSINDYLNLIPTFFNNPNDPFDNNSFYPMYSKCLWPTFLSESYSREIIRRCWEKYGEGRSKNSSLFNDFDDVLPGGFKKNLVLFSLWNLFTNIEAEDDYYSEGRLFPIIKTKRLNKLSDNSFEDSLRIMHTAAQYYLLDDVFPKGGYKIGPSKDFSNLAYAVKAYTKNGEIDTMVSMNSIFTLPNTHLYKKIKIGIVNTSSSDNYTGKLTFQFDSALTTDTSLTSPKEGLLVYPNPFKDKINVKESKIDWNAKPYKLSLFSVDGAQVYKENGVLEPKGRVEIISTDLTAGVYLYYIKIGDKKYQGKLIKK